MVVLTREELVNLLPDRSQCLLIFFFQCWPTNNEISPSSCLYNANSLVDCSHINNLHTSFSLDFDDFAFLCISPFDRPVFPSVDLDVCKHSFGISIFMKEEALNSPVLPNKTSSIPFLRKTQDRGYSS